MGPTRIKKRKMVAAAANRARSASRSWSRYYQKLVRLGLTTPKSKRAILTPKFAVFDPIKTTGTPASEIIIAERGAG